jgi:hypothetical protein
VTWSRRGKYWWACSSGHTVAVSGPAPPRFCAFRPVPPANPYRAKRGEMDFEVIDCFDDLASARAAAERDQAPA